MKLILPLIAFGAWIVDQRYMKNGGLRATRTEKMVLRRSMLLAFVAPAGAVYPFRKTGDFAATLLGFFVVLVCCFWELWRWWVRRKNPLS